MERIQLFKKEYSSSDVTKHVKAVYFYPNTKTVAFETYSIGPRGGVSAGYPGFSAEEFLLIQRNFAQAMAGATTFLETEVK